MANALLTPDIIALEALRILQANTIMGGLVYTGYTDEFTQAKVGDTISLRKPASFEAKNFDGEIEVQNIQEDRVALKLDQHLDVSVAVRSKEWTLELNDFAGRVIVPAMVALNQRVDEYLCGLYRQFNQVAGAAGTQPTALADLANLDMAMNEAKIPVANRRVVVSPVTKASLFSIPEVARADARGDDGTALRDASMGRIMGMDWYMDQNIQKHASGTAQAVTALKVSAEVAAGSDTLALSGGSGAETLLAGDVFSVAGVDGTFTVLEDVTASGGAFAGVKFSPKAPEGGFPANAAVTIEPDHIANVAFVREAIALAVVPLELPQGADGRAAYRTWNGLGIRVVYGYDITAKTDTISFDMLIGAKVIDPRLGVRFMA